MTATSAEGLRAAVLQALARVAPEVDPDRVAEDVPFRDQLDLDSMDFLNFVIALHETSGVDVPEADYAEVATLAGCVRYLAARQGSGG